MIDNVGFRTDIFQIKSGGPIAIASFKHVANPQQVKAFQSRGPAGQAAFWRTVRLELLRYGISFLDLKLDGDGVVFSDSVVVGRGFSGTELLQRMLFVRSGARLYQELLLELQDTTSIGGA